MFKRKSVLYTWCISYGLLLLMMVVLCVMLGFGARRQLIREYKSITQTLQQRTNASIDAYFSSLERTAYEVGNDYLVMDFIITPDPTGSKYYNLSPIQQLLNVRALQAGSVRHYLYMDNIGRALSSEAIYRTHDFYTVLGLQDILTEEEFAALLGMYHYNELFVFEKSGSAQAMMISSIPLIGSSPKGALVQVIQPDAISEMVRSNAALENSTTVLLDADGVLLNATGDAAVAALLQSADLASIEDDEIVLDGGSYWIAYQRTTKAAWQLVTVVPMSSIWAKSDWIVRQSLPIVVGIVLFSAALCLLFLYLQYRPLHRLRKAVAGTQTAQGGNEYDALLAAFDDARSSRDQIQTLWVNQTNELWQEMIRSCIEGDIIYNERHMEQVVGQLDMGALGKWFCVALFELEEDAGRTPAEERALFEHAAGETLAGGVHARADCLPRGTQWLVLLCAASHDEAYARMETLCGKVRQEAGVQELAMSCACSKPWREFQNIHLAYLEASEVLHQQSEQALLTQQDGHPAAPDAPGRGVPRLSAEQEELLARYLLAGNAAEARAVLDLILRVNWDEQKLPVSICRCLAYDLLSGILRAVGTQPEMWEAQREALRADLHKLRHVNAREEIAGALRQTVERVAAAFAAGRTAGASAGREQPMERLMRCVNEHYRDLDFNVSRAAEYLGMNAPYLSNLFKQQTGIGLLSYINSLRVTYAKQCIVERHLTVAQAAHEAGFENINTFIRLFKKYEGITPGSIHSAQGTDMV